MCREYEYSAWRCAKKHDCPGFTDQGDVFCDPPTRPQLVACTNAINRARTAGWLFPLETTPTRIPFALRCFETSKERESPEGDNSNDLILPVYCPYHALKDWQDKLVARWNEGMDAAMSARPVGNGKMLGHLKMYGFQIRLLVETYIGCLEERAGATGGGEVHRLARKWMDHLLKQLIDKEIPSYFSCDVCLDARVPLRPGLAKGKRIPNAVWTLKAQTILAEVDKKGRENALQSYGLDEYHKGCAFGSGKFLFRDMMEPAEAIPGIHTHEFWKNVNIQRRIVEEVQAMMGPRKSAQRRARHAAANEYPHVRVMGDTPAPGL